MVTKYESPPDYLLMGRALVYNCTGRHWACVDDTSYLQCKKNHIYLQKHAKKAECVETEVYATSAYCRIAQKMKIEQLSSTAFCD